MIATFIFGCVYLIFENGSYGFDFLLKDKCTKDKNICDLKNYHFAFFDQKNLNNLISNLSSSLSVIIIYK